MRAFFGGKLVMTTLLEINADLLAFKALLDEANDELSPETEQAIEAWFSELTTNRDAKIDNYVAYCRDLQLRAAARKEEAERLLKRVQVDENTAKRLKQRLLDFMQQQGERSIETARYKVSVCGNGGKTPVDIHAMPDELPAEFQKVKVEPDVDKIRTALEAGAKVYGCWLGKRGQHLRIS